MRQNFPTEAFSRKPVRDVQELSDAEKEELAEALTLQTGVFGAVLVAGVLYLALLWMLGALF